VEQCGIALASPQGPPLDSTFLYTLDCLTTVTNKGFAHPGPLTLRRSLSWIAALALETLGVTRSGNWNNCPSVFYLMSVKCQSLNPPGISHQNSSEQRLFVRADGTFRGIKHR
jgi:hypothetical protein